MRYCTEIRIFKNFLNVPFLLKCFLSKWVTVIYSQLFQKQSRSLIIKTSYLWQSWAVQKQEESAMTWMGQYVLWVWLWSFKQKRETGPSCNISELVSTVGASLVQAVCSRLSNRELTESGNWYLPAPSPAANTEGAWNKGCSLSTWCQVLFPSASKCQWSRTVVVSTRC